MNMEDEMRKLTVEDVKELSDHMETAFANSSNKDWNRPYYENYKRLIADWHRQREEIEQYKKG